MITQTAAAHTPTPVTTPGPRVAAPALDRMLVHDLRNWICAIKMSAEILDPAQGDFDEACKDMARDSIRHACDRVTALLAAPHDPAAGADVNACIRACVEGHAATARRKSIRLMAALPGQLSVVRGDAVRLDRIIGNLVGNALKFTPAGGAVTISAEALDCAVSIYVRDQGPGVLPHEAERLFEAGIRGSARPTAGEPSTGLGLAIARHLAREVGGEVTVAQDGAPGATFVVTLPVAGC